MLTECEQFARAIVLIGFVFHVTISESGGCENKRAINERDNVVKFDSIWGISDCLN